MYGNITDANSEKREHRSDDTMELVTRGMEEEVGPLQKAPQHAPLNNKCEFFLEEEFYQSSDDEFYQSSDEEVSQSSSEEGFVKPMFRNQDNIAFTCDVMEGLSPDEAFTILVAYVVSNLDNCEILRNSFQIITELVEPSQVATARMTIFRNHDGGLSLGVETLSGDSMLAQEVFWRVRDNCFPEILGEGRISSEPIFDIGDAVFSHPLQKLYASHHNRSWSTGTDDSDVFYEKFLKEEEQRQLKAQMEKNLQIIKDDFTTIAELQDAILSMANCIENDECMSIVKNSVVNDVLQVVEDCEELTITIPAFKFLHAYLKVQATQVHINEGFHNMINDMHEEHSIHEEHVMRSKALSEYISTIAALCPIA